MEVALEPPQEKRGSKRSLCALNQTNQKETEQQHKQCLESQILETLELEDQLWTSSNGCMVIDKESQDAIFVRKHVKN
jgi:hypothetical protein